MIADGIVHGDSTDLLPKLPAGSVDLFFTSPPYADARAYSRIHPDHYVDWFLPYAEKMLAASTETGSLETYIWAKPNAVPGKFGPRTKDAFEYVYHFARGTHPYFDLDAVRVPYRADAAEIARRAQDANGRRNTAAGFGRDRTKTYLRGGADPGNVISVPQTYNQHRGVAHTAAMPEGLAEFFIRCASPKGGLVVDPFAGSGTTVAVARRYDRQAIGFELHSEFVAEARRRLAEGSENDDPPATLHAVGS